MRSSNERISMKKATIFIVLLVSLHSQKNYTAEIAVISHSRDHPVTGTSSGTLKIVYPGNLVLVNNGTNDVVWSSNITSPGIALASLDDTGNLIACEFTWSADTSGYPQDLLKQGTSVKYRLGPWNGRWFSGNPGVNGKIIRPDMVINETEVVYTYALLNSSVKLRLVLSSSGVLERWVWADDKCSCLDETRFVPRNQKNWEIADWADGCVRRTRLDCKNGTDGFIKYQNVKLPDTRTSWFNMTISTRECEAICFLNCSCMAYANADIRGDGSGCLLWFNELLDIRVFPDGIQVTSAQSSSEQKGRANIKIILPVVFLGVLLIGLSSTWFWYSWRKRHHAQTTREGEFSNVGESQRNAMELPLFSFSTIAKDTASFSPDNKIGEGGFGPVYKAWRMHNEGRSMEIIDATLGQSIDSLEVIRSIIVGLLCVQQSPEDRPNMSSVVLMFGNEGALLKPKQPAFFTERNELGADISSSTCPTNSTNGLTVTEVVAR
ncbi:hypothetical protein L1887_25440 [Cichorium endivia]|nr:hypothetical protein L1887_25440 [Cichorium endivia]